MKGTRFQWTVSYQGETEFDARLESGRTVTLALRTRATEYREGGAQTRAAHEREIVGAVGIVYHYRNSREPITPELFEEFRAFYATQTHYPAVSLSRGYYQSGTGWIRV